MGGSAISGDLLYGYLKQYLHVPVYINRSYYLPAWVSPNTLVLTQSYSGNTEETLSTFHDASAKKCHIVGVSSGGHLREYCQKDNIPFLQIPSGYAPRAATGYLLFTSLFLLKKLGVTQNPTDDEFKEVITTVEKVRNTCNKTIPEGDNVSKQLAKKLFQTIPQIYGWEIYKPIARRWCTQFNENSKIIARFDTVPESNHNDIVGWSQNPDIAKLFTCVLFRDSHLESANMSVRLNFMRDLFSQVAADVIEIQVKGQNALAKMMYAMYIGDFCSCYLAVLRNIDPTPVNIIKELKEKLTRLSV
jgi:glucose/mannose-6-phosphate isomerase